MMAGRSLTDCNWLSHAAAANKGEGPSEGSQSLHVRG
jgi:hypothetical protein